jgi:hypothetical protein
MKRREGEVEVETSAAMGGKKKTKRQQFRVERNNFLFTTWMMTSFPSIGEPTVMCQGVRKRTLFLDKIWNSTQTKILSNFIAKSI